MLALLSSPLKVKTRLLLCSLGMLLAGCGDLPKPFKPLDKQSLRTDLTALPGSGGIVVLPLAGIGTLEHGEVFATAIADSLITQEIPASTSQGNPLSLYVSGRASFAPATGPELATSPSTATEAAEPKSADSANAKDNSAAPQTPKTDMAEDSPPSENDTSDTTDPSTADPSKSAAADQPDSAMADTPAAPADPFEGLDLESLREVVIGWEVLNRDEESLIGYRQTTKIAFKDWGNPNAHSFRALTQSAAARIGRLMKESGLVTVKTDAVQAPEDIKRIIVLAAKGAPGDGNTALPLAMKAALIQKKIPMAQDQKNADYRLDCRVKVESSRKEDRQLTIIWRLKDAKGKEIGKIEQANRIKYDMISKKWGLLAEIIAKSAVPGMVKLIELAEKKAEETQTEDATPKS